MDKMKLLRSRSGLSLDKLAKKSGVGIATLARLESGGKAYLSTLVKVANALEVDLEELLEFEAVSHNKGKTESFKKPKPELPTPPTPQEPVKFRFTGQVKDNGWRLSRELDLSISTVRGFMSKLPGVEGMSYEELRQAAAKKFKKAE